MPVEIKVENRRPAEHGQGRPFRERALEQRLEGGRERATCRVQVLQSVCSGKENIGIGWRHVCVSL